MANYKTAICKKCGPNSQPKLIYAAGLCYTCYWLELKLRSFKKSLAKKNSPKVLVNQNINQIEKKGLQNWFLHHINNSGSTCENCGLPLNFMNNTIAFSCQAHILPKSIFKSVKANIYNHLTLGGLFQNCNCHGQYDTNWMNAEKMPVFSLAIERFVLFKNDIEKSELKSLPHIFSKYL